MQINLYWKNRQKYKTQLDLSVCYWTEYGRTGGFI